MKVRALQRGYIAEPLNRRVKEGEVFTLPEKACKKGKGGELLLPSWVEAVDGKKAPEKESEASSGKLTSKDQEVI